MYAYEPHPQVYKEFCENKRIWKQTSGWEQIESRNVALSNASGTGFLNIPKEFRTNRGLASLMTHGDKLDKGGTRGYSVPLAKLDDLVNIGQSVALVKVDVEGHELEVLKGGAKLITHHVRDVLFEEHRSYPSDVSRYLKDKGFTIFRLHKTLLGPRAQRPAEHRKMPTLPWEPPSYLATKQPLRLIERMKRRGWRCLSNN